MYNGIHFMILLGRLTVSALRLLITERLARSRLSGSGLCMGR